MKNHFRVVKSPIGSFSLFTHTFCYLVTNPAMPVVVIIKQNRQLLMLFIAFGFIMVRQVWGLETVIALPRIFDSDLYSPQVQATLLELDGTSFTHPHIPASCVIKVKTSTDSIFHSISSTVFCSTRTETTAPYVEDFMEWKCMNSQATSDKVFHLTSLQGAGYASQCPNGSVLLKVHEDIGRQIGATMSRLLVSYRKSSSAASIIITRFLISATY